MEYKVGQVLYVILRKEMVVYPVQIVEEIVKKTLEGESTTYVVQAGIDQAKKVLLNEVDGEVFESADKAKKLLIDRVSISISQKVEEAKQRAKKWYTNCQKAQENALQPLLDASQSQDESDLQVASDDIDIPTYVELPDGTKAKVNSLKVSGATI
jgi:hypothetical protein